MKSSDIHYPCDDERIASVEVYLPGCWYNQSIYLNMVFKGDNLKVANECLKVEDSESKNMCFDAIFRGLNAPSGNNVAMKYKQCDSMPLDWRSKCITTQAGAAFQQGDNILPLKVCAYANDLELQRDCYGQMYSLSKYYTNRVGRNEFCMQIPAVYRGDCPTENSK